MSSITEQFSAVTKSQLEAQFQMFNSLAHTAVDSAEKLIALNINATKASVEKSSAAAKKLLEVKDAKELFTAGREAPTGLDSVLAYSRELFAIASGVQAELIKSTRGAALPQFTAPGAASAAASSVAPIAASAAASASAAVAESAKASAPAVEAVKTAAPAAVASPAPAPVQAAAPVVAAVATEAAAPTPAPAASLQAAVSAAVHAADAPAADTPATPAKRAPQPLAATVAPTTPAAIKAAIKPALKPVNDTAPAVQAKQTFPTAKPIALVADTKPSKLKAVAPKGKPVDAPTGKHKK